MKKPFTIRGVVRAGAGRGRQLGFPTANLKLPFFSRVPDGVFVATVALPGREELLQGAAFVGTPKMFGNFERRLEVHVLDFSGDLTGKHVTVQLLHRLRGVERFASPEALQHAITEDIRGTRAYFDQTIH